MAGQNSGIQAPAWRAIDGRVINPGDVLAPCRPSFGENGIVWITDGGSWMITCEEGAGVLVAESLHQWLKARGYNPSDDTYNVRIIMNMLNEGNA